MSARTGQTGPDRPTALDHMMTGRIQAATAAELYAHWVHGCGRAMAAEVDAALAAAISELQDAREALGREVADLASADQLDPAEVTRGDE
ncbi:hypothetical protein FZ103_00120 [Streptomonospora sp. PA3]|uniref:hypothetical protein n=1 Tax=Streptomonospora sp. PA3 TaxID=2607326 RepID=UPI0012DCE538|nr:hypothetical protein [Streptomonospora sp. PA3]MUL39599.1 hypothetical protein [Streptomonospora sp. PA3]